MTDARPSRGNVFEDLPFDCVRFMRDTRDEISAEIAEMSYVELTRWLRSHEFEDETLNRHEKRAAAKSDETDRPSPDR